MHPKKRELHRRHLAANTPAPKAPEAESQQQTDQEGTAPQLPEQAPPTEQPPVG